MTKENGTKPNRHERRAQKAQTAARIKAEYKKFNVACLAAGLPPSPREFLRIVGVTETRAEPETATDPVPGESVNKGSSTPYKSRL